MTEAKATAIDSTAISLPPGSFELSALEDVADKAVKAKEGERAAVVADALAEANQRPDALDEPGRLPGHKLETVERVVADGVEQPKQGGKKGETEIVGALVVTEHVQVFDPKAAEEEIEAAAEPIAAAGAAPAGPASAGAGATT